MSTTRPKEMLSLFREVSEDEVKKIINRMATKSCDRDPIPTSLLKQILPAVIYTITEIMNMSQREGSFASNWKTAIVRPLLKKVGLSWSSIISGQCQICPFWQRLLKNVHCLNWKNTVRQMLQYQIISWLIGNIIVVRQH